MTIITDNHRHIAHMNFTVAAFFASLSFLYLPTCHNGNDNNNGFIYGARLTNAPMRSQQSATVAIPKDTTKKKVFVPAVKIPVDSLGATIYYMRLIMQDFGIEMSGSKIREYQNIAEQQLQRLSKYLSIKDSIEIVQPKK